MDRTNAFPQRWPLLIAIFTAMAALTLILPSAMRGMYISETTYAFEVVPGAPELTRSELQTGKKVEGVHHRSAIQFLLMEGALFALYFLALQLLRKGATRGQERFAFLTGTALVLLPLLSPVMLSIDVVFYGALGRVVAFQSTSPNIHPPPLAADDPYLQLLDVYFPCPYGPLWVLVCDGVARIAGDRVGLAILLFRCIAALGVVAAGLAIRFTLRRRAPHAVGYGLVFLMWNPLVSLETGGAAHNDALTIAFLLAAFALREMKRPGLMMVLLACSTLVKYSTSVLIPLFLIDELRKCANWRSTILRCTLGLALPTALAFGLLNREITVREKTSPLDATFGYALGEDYTNSWHELAYGRLKVALGDPPELSDIMPGVALWWVAPNAAAELRDRPSDEGKAQSTADEAEPLIAAPTADEQWLLVRGRDGKIGYLKSSDATAIDRPEWVDSDPQFISLEWSPGTTKISKRASSIIRLTTTGAFGLFWLFCLFRVYRGGNLAAAASAVLMAVCLLLGGWFWPWYMLWALAAAAVAPGRRVAVLAGLLTFGVTTLYPALGWGGPFEEFRPLVAFGGPLVLFALWAAISGSKPTEPTPRNAAHDGRIA